MVKGKIRVGILAYDLSEVRGGTKLALTLGNELKKAGCEVAYSCVFERIKEMEEAFGDKYNFKIYKTKKTFIGNKLVHYTTLWNHFSPTYKLCKEFKPDVVLEIGGIITSLVPPILLKIPTIHYCTFPVSKYAEVNIYKVNKLSIFQLKLFSLFEKVMIRKISKLITMCQFTDKIVKQIWDKKTEIITPPTDTKLFKPGKKKNIILSVCRYDPVYRLEELIKIFKKLNKKKNYELHLTAQLDKKDRPYYKNLKTLVKGEKIFLHHDLGNKELIKLYRKAKVFWYTSFSTFGLIFVEAQASGLPVIAFKRGGGAEEILIDNQTGFLVEDFDSLYEKTKILMKDKKLLNRMSIASRKNANRFDNETFKKRFSQVIKNTLSI